MNVLNPPVFDHIVATTGENLKVITFELGVWDMNTFGNTTVNLPITMDPTKILGIDVIIISDNQLVASPLNRWDNTSAGASMAGAVSSMNATTIGMDRRTGGDYDGIAYQSAVLNRGYCTIWYME